MSSIDIITKTLARPRAFVVLPLILLLGLGLPGCKSSADGPHKGEGAKIRQQNKAGTPQGGRKDPGSPARRVQGGEETAPVIVLSEEEKSAVDIDTVKVAVRPIRHRLSAVGKVYAPQTKKAIVSYAFPARVAAIQVQIGEWVRRGQTLVTLHSEEVGTAKSEFYKARADFELAKSSYEREKRLFEGGVGPQKNLLTTEAELKVAEASLNAAEKKLHVLGFTEEQVKAINGTHQINPVIDLYAPITGKVIENNAILGMMVDESKEILTIIDPTLLWIDADVYERDISKIVPGQKAEVTVPAYPGETFSGTVTYIGDVLKEETRTITVRMEVPNSLGKLKPGMFADIRISLEQRKDCLALPRSALLEEGDAIIVFVKNGERFSLRTVKTGVEDNGFVEILEGIEEGEEIVTNGNYQLKSKLHDETLKKAHVH